MHRRQFLKLVGFGTVGAGLSLSIGAGAALGASQVITFRGSVYRGDTKGRIFVSKNGGATWQVHTKLGSGYSVNAFAVDARGRLAATIGYRRRSFTLILSADAQRWMVA